jgi:hypothetical protein
VLDVALEPGTMFSKFHCVSPDCDVDETPEPVPSNDLLLYPVLSGAAKAVPKYEKRVV